MVSSGTIEWLQMEQMAFVGSVYHKRYKKLKIDFLPDYYYCSYFVPRNMCGFYSIKTK